MLELPLKPLLLLHFVIAWFYLLWSDIQAIKKYYELISIFIWLLNNFYFMSFFRDNAFLSTKNQDKQLKMVVNAIAKNRYLIFPTKPMAIKELITSM